MRLRVFLAAALASLAAAGLANAQPAAGTACRSERVSREELVDFPAAYAAAEARARAWRADAVLFKASHTLFAPVDDQGRAPRWNLDFLSPKNREAAEVTIDKGVLSCGPSSVPAYEPPALAPTFEKDVKRLLAEAAAHGAAAYTARGYTPRAELRVGSRRWLFRFMLGDPIRHYWYVDYMHPNERKVFRATFDANDGRFVGSETYRMGAQHDD